MPMVRYSGRDSRVDLVRGLGLLLRPGQTRAEEAQCDQPIKLRVAGLERPREPQGFRRADRPRRFHCSTSALITIL